MHGSQPASGQSPPHPDASKLSWAIYYARQRGWAVLPLYTVEGGCCTCGDVTCKLPGKHPRTQHGVTEASAHPWHINRWWRGWPTANVGIATGTASGLLVLNIDPRNGGDASFAQLQSKFADAFKEPLEVRTSVEGRQFYFACSDPISSRANILPGIDVKADGGYVVAPPSLDVGGSHYQFAPNSGSVVPTLPAALRDLIAQASSQETQSQQSPQSGTQQASQSQKNHGQTATQGQQTQGHTANQGQSPRLQSQSHKQTVGIQPDPHHGRTPSTALRSSTD